MNNFEKFQIINLFAEDSSSDDEAAMEEISNFVYAETSSSSSSPSSEDSQTDPQHHIKVSNFVEVIDAYSSEDFKSHMRLQRSTVEHLIGLFSESDFLPTSSHGGRSRIGSRKSVFMYIWYISNTLTFRQLGNLFGVSKSSAWVAIKRVSSWLVYNGQEYLKWPEGVAAEETIRLYEEKKKIPGVIGCIDCTHIQINAPKANRECYYNRKQGYSLVLQAVVDSQKKFMDISCGEPGSLHDSRVLRRSDLYASVQANEQTLFPNHSFVLGDSAYPSTSWLVPPFKDNGNLSDLQRRFNYLHSATRISVEHAFGLLKGRFRRLLKFTEQTDLPLITQIIVSACVLHNICILKDDLYTDVLPEQTDEATVETSSDDIVVDTTIERRQTLFNYLLEKRLI